MAEKNGEIDNGILQCPAEAGCCMNVPKSMRYQCEYMNTLEDGTFFYVFWMRYRDTAR